jgi:hypothetical protein
MNQQYVEIFCTNTGEKILIPIEIDCTYDEEHNLYEIDVIKQHFSVSKEFAIQAGFSKFKSE